MKQERRSGWLKRNNWSKWVAIFLAGVLLIVVTLPAMGGLLVDPTILQEYEAAMIVAQSDGASRLQGREYIGLKQMPEYISHAFVAIEDHRYVQHQGVDVIAVTRSLWQDLVQGRLAQGGSTITMQLARNLFLNHDKEWSRKLKEVAIAVYLEQTYTKEEILEMYLNTIYFGHGLYGIEAAANYYFDKTVQMNHPTEETITLSEAAMLAALPKAPEHYSPRKDFDKAKGRQQVVLERMMQLGYLTPEEKENAIRATIVIALEEGTTLR